MNVEEIQKKLEQFEKVKKVELRIGLILLFVCVMGIGFGGDRGAFITSIIIVISIVYILATKVAKSGYEHLYSHIEQRNKK
ncbi:hypothetical protein [Ectobacillus panaciterrae]|uniref:hypothetical protein n=1 Tax=Ectobacillus panaciterrae TaxID=363872 RepID=UPI000415D9FF|nr:hypothetical protein [Ectobacillus panaciterrae]